MQGVYLSISSLRQAVCALVECAILVLALFAAALIRYAMAPDYVFFLLDYEWLLPKAVVAAAIFLLCLYYNELYEDFAVRRRVELFLKVGQSFLVGTGILIVVSYSVPPLSIGRGILLVYVPLSCSLILMWRTVFSWAAGRRALSDRVLILGTGPAARSIAEEIEKRGRLGFSVIGFVGLHQAEVGRRLFEANVLGTTEALAPLAEKNDVSLIVVALEDRRGTLPVRDLLKCRLAGIHVEEAANLYERLTGKILVKNLRPSWLVFSPGFHKPRLLRTTKRVAEFLVASVLSVLFAPVAALIALLVKLDSPGPVLYKQERVGEQGRAFQLIKFRTMRTDAEARSGPVWAAADFDPRMTRLGRRLRKLRLDELPQLVNILRGEMSFVGPRPERPVFVEILRKVIPYYDERHTVKPGITGWAQIKFGYGSTIEDAEEKLQFDLYYIKNLSLIFDIGIVLDTLKVVLLEKGR